MQSRGIETVEALDNLPDATSWLRWRGGAKQHHQPTPPKTSEGCLFSIVETVPRPRLQESRPETPSSHEAQMLLCIADVDLVMSLCLSFFRWWRF